MKEVKVLMSKLADMLSSKNLDVTLNATFKDNKGQYDFNWRMVGINE